MLQLSSPRAPCSPEVCEDPDEVAIGAVVETGVDKRRVLCAEACAAQHEMKGFPSAPASQ